MSPLHTVERRYLSQIFAPNTVALVGASERAGSPSRVLLENLLHGEYKGEFFAVNPQHETVLGTPCHPTVDAIGKPIDLAIIATPADAVPEVMESCRKARVFAVLILSAGLRPVTPETEALLEATLNLARKSGIRILGPSSIGLMRPSIGLNGALIQGPVRSGSVALVSQSGALLTSMVDWARTDEIGFSSIVSLGDRADVVLADVLDFLTGDPQTESILLYAEGFHRPRRLPLRAAGSGAPQASDRREGRVGMRPDRQAARTHSGALVGRDDVFDAAAAPCRSGQGDDLLRSSFPPPSASPRATSLPATVSPSCPTAADLA